jgi:hypothetical protein
VAVITENYRLVFFLTRCHTTFVCWQKRRSRRRTLSTPTLTAFTPPSPNLSHVSQVQGVGVFVARGRGGGGWGGGARGRGSDGGGADSSQDGMLRGGEVRGGGEGRGSRFWQRGRGWAGVSWERERERELIRNDTPGSSRTLLLGYLRRAQWGGGTGLGGRGRGMKDWKAVGSEVKSMCHSVWRRTRFGTATIVRRAWRGIRVPDAVFAYVPGMRERMFKYRERVGSLQSNRASVATRPQQPIWKEEFMAWNCSCPA